MAKVDRLRWILAGLAVASAAYAGEGPFPVKIPPGVPRDVRRDEFGLPLVAYAAIEGAPARQAPNLAAKGVRSLRFGERFFVRHVMKEADSGRDFALLVNPKESPVESDIVGWVEGESCLLGPLPLQTPRGLHRMVAVGLLDGVRASLSPRSGGENALRPGLYYVFKEASVGNEHWVLVGSESNLNREGSLVGWLPPSSARPWDTRLAVEFDKETLAVRVPDSSKDARGAPIYGSEKDLILAEDGASVRADGSRIAPVATEHREVKAWGHAALRFPVLSSVPSSGASGARLEIAFPQDPFTAEGQTGYPERAFSGGAILEDRDLLARVDLLLVVDATASMRFYVKDLRAALGSLIEVVASGLSDRRTGEGRPDVRCALSLYRDLCDEDGLPAPTDTFFLRTMDLSPDAGAVVRFFDECTGGSIDPRAGGDEPEAVFRAVCDSVERTGPSLREGYRLLILVGEAGNHSPDPEGRTAASVASILKRHRCDFLALQVGQKSTFREDFRTQALAIFSELGYAQPLFFRSDEVQATLAREVRGHMGKLRRAHRALMGFALGREAASPEEGRSEELPPFLAGRLRSKGFPVERLPSASGGTLSCGWISERLASKGVSQVRRVWRTERSDLETLQALLASMTKDGVVPGNVRVLWSNAFLSVLGREVGPRESLSDKIAILCKVPFRFGGLARSLAEIERESPEELRSMIVGLRVMYRKMRAVLEEKNTRILVVRDSRGRNLEFREEVLGPRKWWFVEGSGRFAWVPVSAFSD